MNIGTKILKWVLAIMNFIIAVIGLACIILGAIAISNKAKYSSQGLNAGVVILGANILIAVGSIVLVLALLAACGAFFENKCSLILYAVLVSIMIVVVIAFTAFLYAGIAQVKIVFKNAVITVFNHGDVPPDSVFDMFQKQFKCCGVDGPLDYKNFKIPSSCYGPKHVLYVKGCYDDIYHSVFSYLKIAAGIMIGFIVFKILNLTAAITLICSLGSGVKNNA